MWPFSTAFRHPDPYHQSGRLADVLAMIQVLGLDDHAHRTDAALSAELGKEGHPDGYWVKVAREHPEFFRVVGKGEEISLLARHFAPKDAQGLRRLPVDILQQLCEIAIKLHDSQLQRHRVLRLNWAALLTSVLAALASIASLIVQVYTKTH